MNIFPSGWDLDTIPTMTCRKTVVGLQDRQEIEVLMHIYMYLHSGLPGMPCCTGGGGECICGGLPNSAAQAAFDDFS